MKKGSLINSASPKKIFNSPSVKSLHSKPIRLATLGNKTPKLDRSIDYKRKMTPVVFTKLTFNAGGMKKE